LTAPEEENASYQSVALSGSVFVIAAQGIRLILLLASLIVLSRLLTPEDFGLVACLTPITNFILLFSDIGLQQAVIQRLEITPNQINKIFWLTISIGIACTILLCLSSPLIVWFYHDPRLFGLTIASSFFILLTSLAGLPSSLLNRGMHFRTLAGIDVIANLVGFTASLLGAMFGLRYWSLLLSPFFVGLITAGGTIWASGWKPSRPSFKIEKDILGFGAHLTGYNFLNFLALNLDNMLIGRYQGTQQLGFYDRAYKLLVFPLVATSYPLARVVIPILSRVQENKERVRRIYLRIIGLLTLATVPGMAAALAAPQDIILLCFGEKWLSVVPIFCWLGLAGLIQPLNSTAGWLFISQGKTKEMFRWGLFASTTTILAFVTGLHWGAVGVAAAYTLTEYGLRLPGLYWYMGKVSPVRTRDFVGVQGPLLIAAALSWATTRFFFAGIFGLNGIALIASAIGVSYLMAASLCLCHKNGRESLHEAAHFAARFLRFSQKS